MVKVVWTDLAIEDLKSIYDYISKDSKFYADRLLLGWYPYQTINK